ncbi:MAG TPA: hypothetical protein VJ808_10525, partial [Gemmatimonadales bacterium]|nr:hypothetical protein [Gemmatimonadales bacterium]
IDWDRSTRRSWRLPTPPDRLGSIDPAVVAFTNTAFGGALQGDFGPISRTNDANALLGKLDFRLGAKHNATLKYNYTNSRQVNGTFDVDFWGRSANALERDFSHAINGGLTSALSSSLSNEFRFQWAREERPRAYEGPINPATSRPFPDTDIGFLNAEGFNGYRIGMPYFIPVDAYDYRFQVLDNVSVVSGNHLFKLGAEWNRTGVNQTFRGFGNGRMIFTSVPGFLNYVAHGPGYVECADNVTQEFADTSHTGICPDPDNQHIVGPVALYLQQAGIGGLTVDEAGTQTIIQHELALFLQDSWKPTPKLTMNYGLRWEAQIQPDLITPIPDLFYAPFIGQTVTNATGTYEFPGDGTIPSDYSMFQPRLGIAYDVRGDGRSVIRGNAGIYYARIPGLNLASSRSTDGSRGQSIFRSSDTPFLGLPPVYGELLPTPAGGPFQPGVTVFDKDFQNPRTITATVGYDQEVAAGLVAGISFTHARTDHLTRFFNANDPVFGNGVDQGPWSTGLAGGNGIGALTVVQSTAKSRYNGITAELRKSAGERLQFQVNYTLSFDKSDDDNERDPFTFRYARADSLEKEYNWSDRDQRHRVNAWVLAVLPGEIYLNNRVSAYSAQPASEVCGAGNVGTGQRASQPAQRICPDGHVLQRNTIRRDNAYFSWDLRVSKPISFGRGTVEAIVEVFNLTNSDNFKDPSSTGTFFNFDGTIRSGLGEPRQVQAGLRYIF